MARAGRGAAVPRAQAGPGSPRRARRRQQVQPLGKQRPAPWPGLRSKEKKKVNCKPKNQDEQEIPFRLREIMRSRQEMKNPISNKKRKKAAQVTFRKTLEKEAKGVEPDIAVPKFKQRKGESDGAYMQRMHQEAQHVLFLSKNQVPRQPEVQAAPTERSEQKKAKKAFQKRRLDKVQRKKEEKAADRLEQELLRDTVTFGEVVLQPPELTVRPRRSVSKDQPGRRSQMLRMLLSPSGVSQPLTASLARQRIVGEERERAVQAYRVLKQRRWLLHGERPHLTSRKKPEPQP
ncbi:coiled-coil domain-containing protein 137 [Theropithecus gelada]|uniref:Coiled-coil domain containing 137 n=1 Tax=Theropithecus gelada TaxID=9565 RepID=A0A8D2ER52_THEGE|nr:coiled-coil domain-containing protein 137 [Theropithecus gelada]